MYQELIDRLKWHDNSAFEEAATAIEKLLDSESNLIKTANGQAAIIADLQNKLYVLTNGDAITTPIEEAGIFAAAIAKWGNQAQVMMVFEEMSELQKELCKNWRGKDNIEQIADEVADVEIMLDQLKMIYEIKDKVREHRAFKVMRLRKRLEDADCHTSDTVTGSQ